MQTTIQKWGNSLALRIPKAFADSLALAQGVPVTMTIENGKLILEAKPKQYALDELVAQITPENRHAEADTGAVVGEELW